MCYPTPGPRCSNHAYKEYVEAEQRFAACLDPDEKITWGHKLEEKKNAYESTPRGQHELRREADAATGIERGLLLARLRKGEETRKQQLKNYAIAVERKDNSFSEIMKDKEYAKGRYQDACGIAFLFLTQLKPNQEFHIEDTETIISPIGKILILPEKYQNKWAEAKLEDLTFISNNEKLNAVLNSSIDLENLSTLNERKTIEWFIEELESKGYTAFASVNRKTQDVAVLPLDKLNDAYSIGLKSKKRLGGTTSYSGDIGLIETLIKGTPFEDGKLLQPVGTNKTVIYNVLPQAKKVCILSDEFYLAWHFSGDKTDGYFEVRKRHLSNNYNIFVCLKTKRQLSASGINKEVGL